MNSLQNSVREVAEKLLNEKKVDLIIGYKQGTLPLHSTPCFARKAEDVHELIWNASCDANLAKYLIGRKEKIGFIAKGCDARSAAVCIIEKQIPRQNITIIGVPCQGVIDRKKIDKKLDGKEVVEATLNGEQIRLKGEEFELTLPTKDFICDSCITCRHRNPPFFDVFVGEKTSETSESEEFAKISDFELKSAKERWAHFQEELSECIRCYACRNVCPLCYCKTCFVDQTMPTWFGKTNDLSDTIIYHIVRAFHMAGRCVDCGACSRACPMDINLRDLVKKTEKIMKDRFNYEAGVNLDDIPPLGAFEMNDSQEFIK